MEIIRKKICIDDYRSRVIGMLPYVEYNSGKLILSGHTSNGNYGNFPINPLINGSTKIYMDMMRNYYFLKEQFRNGLKLKKIIRNKEEIWIPNFDERKTPYEFVAYDINDFVSNEYDIYQHKDKTSITDNYIVLVSDLEGFIYKGNIAHIKYVDENIIGLFYIPSTLECKITCNSSIFEEIGCPIPGIRLPDYVFYQKIDSIYDEMVVMSASTNPCILKKWEEMGGKAYMDLLSSKKTEFLTKKNEIYAMATSATSITKLDSTIPSINISLLLTSKINDIGVMSSYNEDEEYDTTVSGLEPKIVSPENYKVASQLLTLRDKEFFYDDNGETLPGIFIDNLDENTKKHFYNNITNGVITSKVNGTTLANDYLTSTLESTIPDDYNGIALIKYKNNALNPMRIPYSVNKPVNTYALKEYIPKPYIIVEPKGYLFVNEYSKVFKLTTNTAWSATTNDTWATCTPSSDDANGKETTYDITVTITNDDTYFSEKTTTINFVGVIDEYEVKSSYDIIVLNNEPYLELVDTLNTIDVSYISQTYTIRFKTNTSWVATCPNWCTLNSYEGEGGDNISIILNISKNESLVSQRMGDIIIKSNSVVGIQTRITVIQDIASTLSIEPNVMTLTDNYSKEELIIKCNNKWTIEKDAEWCTLSQNSGEGDTSIIVGRNYKGEEQAQCVLSVKSDDLIKECMVYAIAANGIVLLEPVNGKVTVPYDGGDFYVKFMCYCEEWELSIMDASEKQWCTANITKGGDDKNTVHFECEENDSGANRECRVIIKSIDNPKYYIEIIVTQSVFIPQIILTPKDFVFNKNIRKQLLSVDANIPWKATKVDMDNNNLDWMVFNESTGLTSVVGQGTGNETITLSVNDNVYKYSETGSEGAVRVEGIDGSGYGRATVFWDTTSPSLLLDKISFAGAITGSTTNTNLEFGYVPTTIDIYFKTNTRWKLDPINADWISTYGVTTGTTSNSLQSVRIALHNNYKEGGSESRETSVSISLINWPNKTPLTINIKQGGNKTILEPKLQLLTTPTATTIDYKEQQITNKIKYNTSWEFVEVPSGWVIASRNGTVHTNGNEVEDTITFTVKSNTTLQNREMLCTYMLSNYPSTEKVSYKITQESNAKTVNINLVNSIDFSDKLGDLSSRYWSEEDDGRYMTKLRVIFYVKNDVWDSTYATMTIYATPSKKGDDYSRLSATWDDTVIKMIMPKVSDDTERYDKDIYIKVDESFNHDPRFDTFSSGNMFSIPDNQSSDSEVNINWPDITVEIVL